MGVHPSQGYTSWDINIFRGVQSGLGFLSLYVTLEDQVTPVGSSSPGQVEVPRQEKVYTRICTVLGQPVLKNKFTYIKL